MNSSLQVIAAICGNFYQESGINPGIWENLTVGAPGFGLGQWTDSPPTVMRRTALFDWLDANGYARDSGEGQLKFLVHENIWVPSLISQSSYNTLTEFLNSSDTNTRNLTLEFMYHWEGINDGTDNIRIEEAERIYNLFLADDGTRRPWTATNSYLTQTETDNNALLIKDFFSGAMPLTDEEIITIFRKIMKSKKERGGFFVLF